LKGLSEDRYLESSDGNFRIEELKREIFDLGTGESRMIPEIGELPDAVAS
jgi:hypothetical protein